jgi:hypothetical protein
MALNLALPCAWSDAHEGLKLLLDAGANFPFPLYWYYASTTAFAFDMGLTGDYHDRYIDDLKEHLSYVLSGGDVRRSWGWHLLLTEIYSGR